MKKLLIFILLMGTICFPQESYDFSNIDNLVDSLEKQLLDSAQLNQRLNSKIVELQKINQEDKRKIEELMTSTNNADNSTSEAETKTKNLLEKMTKLEKENSQLKIDKKRLIFLAIGLSLFLIAYVTLRVLKLLPQSKALFWWVP